LYALQVTFTSGPSLDIFRHKSNVLMPLSLADIYFIFLPSIALKFYATQKRRVTRLYPSKGPGLAPLV